MTKTTISPSENPIRRQASLGGNVVTRSTTGAYDNGLLFFATVAKVYYQKGTLDFKVTSNSNIVTSAYNNNGVGSAPIPVDFYGTNSNGKVFGHYRPIKTGEKVLLGYIDGYSGTPVVLGVYPDTQANYELISPVSYNTADDTQEYVQETTLGEKKVYPNQQILYEAGTGELARSMNGHSFMYVSKDLTGYLADVNYAYEQIGSFRNSDGTLVEPENDLAGAWLLVHEDNPTASDGDTHRTRFYVDNKGNFQVVFMDTEDTENIAILEGSKDGGFTLTKRFDQSDLTQDSSNYVTLNLGDSTNQSFKVEASSEADSKSQSSSLEVKSDGVYVDGKSLEEYISTSTTVTGEDIDNALPDSTYFKDLQKETQQAGKDAQAAADAAQQAGEDATAAGLQAEQAGEDAKAQAKDIKNRIIYYTSISPEKDVYVPGKYLIINTDTYIADGTINNAYIENGAIDHAKIASEAVGSSQIEDLAVTRAKIANLAVGTAQIENLAVTDEKVGTLSFNHMIGETLDADHINVVNLHGDNITAGTITADKLIINGLGDITSNLGKVTSGEIIAGDGTDGVNVSGLDADNPDEYTPYKKSLLKAQIAVLEAQADAAIAYGKDTGNDYTSVQTALDNLLDGTASLLSDMTVTTEFDHNTITSLETALQTAISNFQTNVNSDLNRQIGLTADGKNKVTYGTEEPSDPSDNDIWIEKNADGTSQIKVYTSDSGWISPVDYNVQAVAKQVSSLPQNYYQTDQPTGTDYNDGSHWYQQTGTDSNGNPVYTIYLWNSSTKAWDKMLNSGEVDNANQITQVKSDLSQATSDIAQAQSDIKTNASNLSSAKSDLQSQIDTANSDIAQAQSDIKTNANNLSSAKSDLQSQVDTANSNITQAQSDITQAQSDITQAQSDIKTNANAISDNKGNISSLTSTASKLSSDMTDAQGNISTLQQDATGFKADIADNKGNIASLTNTVNGLSSTVSDNKGDISSLQNTTSGLSSTVATKANQSDLNTTNSNVSSLTNTVSGLNSTVSSLSSDNTTNKQNISTLQNTANGFTNTVATLQTQVNNSAVGTQMFTGTSQFTSKYWYVWFDNTGTGLNKEFITDENGNKVAHIYGTVTNGGIVGFYNSQYCTSSKYGASQVSVSLDVKGGYGDNGSIYRFGPEKGTMISSSNYDLDSSSKSINDTSYTRVTSAWNTSNPDQDNCIFYVNVTAGDNVDFCIRLIKLEKGSHASDWLANPADNATVTSVSTLTNTVNGLSSTVSNNSGDISTLKNTTSGLSSTVATKANQSDLTTTNSNVSSLTNTVNGLSSTVSDNKGDISSLQNTTSGLSSTVATKANQSDLNTTNSNVSSLTNTVSGLNSTVSSLSSDNTTNKQNISTLQNTANGFTNTVATLQTQVNNSAVGTNLLTNSSFSHDTGYTSWSVVNSPTWSSNNIAYMEYTGSSTASPNYSEVRQTVGGLTVGEWYTLQFNILYCKENTIFHLIAWNSSENHDAAFASTNAGDVYGVKTMTFQAQSTSLNFYLRVYSGGLNFSQGKLEKGSVATDWSANPTDNATVTSVSTLTNTVNGLSNTVADNKGNISTLQNTVNGLSNTVSDNKGNISTLQTKADSFDISVGQLQTSAAGIQLLLGTSGTEQTFNSDFSTVPNWNAPVLVPVTADTTYTYSINITSLTGDFVLGYWYYDSNKAYMGWAASYNFSSTGITTFTFTTPTGTAYIVPHFVFNNSGTHSVTAKCEKLEKGSLATAWCLSPMEQLTSTGNYAGLTINASGLTEVAGSTTVYLSNNNGFEIQKSGLDIFHVDTSGSLIMQGDITAGNISGVDFIGDSLTLTGTLSVTGSLSADNGNVVISSGGITIKGAGLTIGDSNGKTTTYIKSDGTFVTDEGVFSGSATITGSLTLSGDSANINVGGGKFYVDSSGNVTANSFISTSSQITNSNIGQSTITIHNADNSFNATLGEISTDYWGFQLYASGNETWIDANGIHNTDNHGTDTYIKNGIISTNIIDAQSKLHIGNSSSDPRDIWGTDIDVNGLSFGVPVKKSGATTNNASDYETEIQGYINGQGWNYKTTNVNGTGYSGIAIGLATQQAWGNPYGGDFIGIGQFNPTSDIPNASSGNIGSANFDPAIAFWATGSGNAYGAYTVSIEPTLYLGSGQIKTLSGDIDLRPAGSLGLFGGYINMESTGTVHIKANGGNYIKLYSNNEMDIDGGSFWTSNGSGFYFWQGIGGTGGAVVHGKSFANVSLLSAKTNITKLDSAHALSLINQTNVYDYQYKEDVANGSPKHYASFIIDDVNDVSQYTEPDEFLSEDKKGRDDGTQLAYACLAIQELSKQINDLKQQIASLKNS